MSSPDQSQAQPRQPAQPSFHMPLTIAGNWKVFQAQCASKLPPNPSQEQLESIFYAGATVMPSIMKRLLDMDATEEEGAQILARLEGEILQRTVQQLTKASARPAAMAKRATAAQVRQRELAWLLFQVRGAVGNLGHILGQYKTLGPAIESRLQTAIRKLEELDGFTQHTLARDQAIREASFRPAANKPQKESP